MRFLRIILPAAIGLTVCLAGCAAPRSEAPAAEAAVDSAAAVIVLSRKVKNGRVTSGPSRLNGTIEPHLLDNLQNMKVDKFVIKIRIAAMNKKKPEGWMQRTD